MSREQRPRCMALTAAGDQCRNRAATDSDYCGAHGPKAGRPTRLTRALADAIVSALERGAYRSEAAAAAGLHRGTIASWVERGEADLEQEQRTEFADFAVAATRAEAQAELAALNEVRREGSFGDWRAAAWFLERRHPSRWRRRDTIDHSGEVRRTVEVVAPSDEERAAAIAGILNGAGALEPGEDPNREDPDE
jgi:hypothetical protein